jgi:hypothetical protein
MPGTPLTMSPSGRDGRRIPAWLVVLLVLVAVVLAARAAFLAWLRSPAPELDGARLVDAGTALYAELHLREGDAAALEFLRGLAAHDDTTGAHDRIAELLARVAPHLSSREQEFDEALPLTLVWTRQEVRPGVAGPMLLAVGMPKAGNTPRLLGIAFSIGAWKQSGERQSARHRDVLMHTVSFKIGALETSYWSAVVGSHILLSRDPDAVRSGIDRLLDGAGAGSRPALELLAARPADAAVYIAGRPGHAVAVAEALAEVSPELARAFWPALERADGAFLWAGLAAGDLARGELHVRPAPAADAPGAGPEPRLLIPLSTGAVAATIAPAGSARDAWSFEVEGLGALVLQALRAAGVEPRR